MVLMNRMKTISALCLLLGLLVNPGQAQDTPKNPLAQGGEEVANSPDQPPPKQKKPVPVSNASAVLFNFKFSGGPITEFFKELERQSGEKINLVMTPAFAVQAKTIQAPAMNLQEVIVPETIEALNLALREVKDVHIAVTRTGQRGAYIWTGMSMIQPQPDRRTSRVFYVGNLLEKYKIEDIITAIQTTWSFSNPQPKAELKYHQDTQLLIVFAPPLQLEEVTNILEELTLGVEGSKGKGYQKGSALPRPEGKDKTGPDKKSPPKS